MEKLSVLVVPLIQHEEQLTVVMEPLDVLVELLSLFVELLPVFVELLLVWVAASPRYSTFYSKTSSVCHGRAPRLRRAALLVRAPAFFLIDQLSLFIDQLDE